MYKKNSKFWLVMLFYLASTALAGDSALIIPEVNLNTTKIDAKKEDEQIQTTYFTRKKIAQSPTTQLTDLLKQEQSIVRVTNNSNDNTQPILSIRGFGDNAFANTLIVIDGFPLTNPSVLAPSFNSITLSDIQGITIVQGSEGSYWGDQAVGGVVNILTRHPEKLLADANISYGSYNKQFYNLLLGDKFSNGIFFKLLGFSNQTDNYRQHNQQTDKGLTAQVGRDYATGSLTLNFKAFDDTINIPGGLTQQQYDTDPRQATNTTNFSHYATQIYQLLSKQALNDNWLLETRLGHNQIDGDGFVGANFNRKDLQDSINPVLIGTVYTSKLTLGYEGEINSYDLVNPTLHQNANVHQNDVFAQTITPLFKKFDFTLGGRSAWQDNSLLTSAAQSLNTLNRVFVTEQGMTFHPASNWQFFIRRDGNFRFPKANEQTSLPPGTDTLLPQTGVSYEAGSEWQTLRQKAQLSIYRLALTDEIAFNPTQTSSAPSGSYSNFDKTLRNGMTLTENYHLTPKLSFDSQFNYVDARFAAGADDGKLIPAVPAVNGNVGFDYQFVPHWQFKYMALYTGSRFASQDVDNVGEKLPGYWLQNTAIQYFYKSVNLSFEIENLFNQRYANFVVYSPTTQTETFYPGAGRNYLLTAKAYL